MFEKIGSHEYILHILKSVLHPFQPTQLLFLDTVQLQVACLLHFIFLHSRGSQLIKSLLWCNTQVQLVCLLHGIDCRVHVWLLQCGFPHRTPDEFGCKSSTICAAVEINAYHGPRRAHITMLQAYHLESFHAMLCAGFTLAVHTRHDLWLSVPIPLP